MATASHPPIILASGSRIRAELLTRAGLAFTVQTAPVDERAIEAGEEAKGADAVVVSSALARAKAQAVSALVPDALVIGADQTLSLNGHAFHKPKNRAEAYRQLASLAGHTHQLNSAVAVVQNGVVQFETVAIAKLTMRPLSDAYLEHYLNQMGDVVLTTVGGYQLEGLGIQLFEQIEGDYFTILGLPLLPLLGHLRDVGVMLK